MIKEKQTDKNKDRQNKDRKRQIGLRNRLR